MCDNYCQVFGSHEARTRGVRWGGAAHMARTGAKRQTRRICAGRGGAEHQGKPREQHVDAVREESKKKKNKKLAQFGGWQ